jgi:predicted transcriptional regulator
VWFPSAESFVKVLSDKNRKLLGTIRDAQPKSLAELAELTGRKTSNLSRTLRTMERYGIVKLEGQRQGRVIARVTVDLSLGAPEGRS